MSICSYVYVVNMYMHMYMHMPGYMSIHRYVHVHLHVHVHLYVHVHMHMYVCVCVYDTYRICIDGRKQFFELPIQANPVPSGHHLGAPFLKTYHVGVSVAVAGMSGGYWLLRDRSTDCCLDLAGATRFNTRAVLSMKCSA